MNCDNLYCIYQCEGVCTTENISINRAGMCMDCIQPNIDSKILEKAKQTLLTAYENADSEQMLK